MNTHRAVRQFLAKEENKTELKSEKVELASIGDLKKASDALENNSFAQYDKEASAYDSLLRSIKERVSSWKFTMKELAKNKKELQNQVNNFSKAAKDLGLNPDSVDEYKNAIRIIKIASTKEKDAATFLK